MPAVNDLPTQVNVDTSVLAQDVCNFKAGQLQEFAINWKRFTSDAWVFSTLSGADIEFLETPYQRREPKPIRFTTTEEDFLQLEIDKLLAKKVIVKSHREKGDFVSNIFLRKKKDGSHRVILNLSVLNKDIQYRHFKMESLQSAVNLMTKNCFMGSVDLKDAYYSVPVNRQFWKLLKFKHKNCYYTYTCLPNGLACAPRIFTKLLKPIFSTLRKQGFSNSAYIDDSYLQGDSYEECRQNIQLTVAYLREAGFVLHPTKSVFEPQQQLQYIGFILDSVAMTVRITPEKADNIRLLCQQLLNKKLPTIRQVAKVVGKLVAALPGVKYGQLYYRCIDIDKIRALALHKGNYEGTMTLSKQAKLDLQWWVQNIHVSSKPILTPNPQLILQSDASNLGWGGVHPDGRTTGGHWSGGESKLHINQKELLAAMFTLKSFCNSLSNLHILIQVDNTNTVIYITKQGGKKPKCNLIARALWEWAIERGIWVSASFIPGKHNVAADRESRTMHDNMEWRLNTNYFKICTDLWGQPEVDLFASRLNTQVEKFVSWKPDPFAFAIDAFTVKWDFSLCYIFPPFGLLGRVLKKISDDNAMAVVVAPLWTTQPWFTKLFSLLIDCVFLLPRNTQLLTSQASHQKPPPNLQLVVCRVSGDPLISADFRQRLSASSSCLGGNLHCANMKPISESGMDFVIKGVKIPIHQLRKDL